MCLWVKLLNWLLGNWFRLRNNVWELQSRYTSGRVSNTFNFSYVFLYFPSSFATVRGHMSWHMSMCPGSVPYKQVIGYTRATPTIVCQFVGTYCFIPQGLNPWACVKPCLHTVLRNNIQGIHDLDPRSCLRPCVYTDLRHTGWGHDRVCIQGIHDCVPNCV